MARGRSNMQVSCDCLAMVTTFKEKYPGLPPENEKTEKEEMAAKMHRLSASLYLDAEPFLLVTAGGNGSAYASFKHRE